MSIENEKIIEGEVDPKFNKMVKFLVIQTNDFAVYIDESLDIQWFHDHLDLTNDGLGAALNRIAIIESKSKFITDRETLFYIKRQLAEGLARQISYPSSKLSKEMFDTVETFLNSINAKTSWGWYFNYAYFISTICCILWILFWIFRDKIIIYIGAIGFEIILGGLAGSLGALISIFSRSNKITIDANIGKIIHRTEGIARIVVGILGASLSSLLYKGGLILSGINFSGSQFAIILSLAIVSGASERLVPNLISNIEKSSSIKT